MKIMISLQYTAFNLLLHIIHGNIAIRNIIKNAYKTERKREREREYQIKIISLIIF